MEAKIGIYKTFTIEGEQTEVSVGPSFTLNSYKNLVSYPYARLPHDKAHFSYHENPYRIEGNIQETGIIDPIYLGETSEIVLQNDVRYVIEHIYND